MTRQTSSSNIAQPLNRATPLNGFGPLLDHATYQSFQRHCPFNGDGVYELVYDLCQASIKTKKRPVAIANLKKIFTTTFKICAQSSFAAMSLRELSIGTGISMGGLYACIQSKQDLLLMAQALVDHVTSELELAVATLDQPWLQLEKLLRTQIYISTQLQPWFFFLYFETHSLEPTLQQKSKNIEMRSLRGMQSIIQQGNASKVMRADDALAVASVCVAMLQDWYLKPWKYRELGVSADTYADKMVDTAKQLLRN